MPDFIETFALDSKMFKDENGLRETGDGYMICRPRIARTGIQEYLGVEVGRPDLKTVRVYRPESEVFSADAMSSLAHKPVTVEHPSEPVTAKNWRKYAVGRLDDEIVRDGEFIRVPLILMDAEAIEVVKAGKSQLSVGYSAQLQWADGVTKDGEKYDVTQTAIRANHVAITHTARGGPKLRMGDNVEHQRRKTMATRTIQVDGISVEMEERDLQVVERRLANLQSEVATAQAALATAQTTAQNDVATARTETANAKAEVQTKLAEIATLQKQLGDAKLTPAQIDKMVSDRAATVTRAKAIIGDALVVDGKTDADMRRQVVNAKMGDVAKDWSDDMINASFNTLSVLPTNDGINNGLSHVISVVRANDTGNGDPRVKAYGEYDDQIQNRWKTAGVRHKA
jgi:hypothetical protein